MAATRIAVRFHIAVIVSLHYFMKILFRTTCMYLNLGGNDFYAEILQEPSRFLYTIHIRILCESGARSMLKPRILRCQFKYYCEPLKIF